MTNSTFSVDAIAVVVALWNRKILACASMHVHLWTAVEKMGALNLDEQGFNISKQTFTKLDTNLIGGEVARVEWLKIQSNWIVVKQSYHFFHLKLCVKKGSSIFRASETVVATY